jgi:demethylmenaquinone methyltransferase/2-methoxy-6-polyprenyl-1,4-benzoquinol methylase
VNTFLFDEATREYYSRRAGEYDDWWLGEGLFAERQRPGWSEEVAELIALLAALPPLDVLDVGCGSGFLTQHLTGDVTALDQSTEMLEIAATRIARGRVICGEALPLPFPSDSFDLVLTSHLYGHLHAGEREQFLAEARRVAPRLVVIDSALREDAEREGWQERVLNDGSRHRVYKRYFTGGELAGELGGGHVIHAGRWFVAVASERSAPPDGGGDRARPAP